MYQAAHLADDAAVPVAKQQVGALHVEVHDALAVEVLHALRR